MVPPIAGLGPSSGAIEEAEGWLTPDRLTRVRGIHMAQPEIVKKLRGVGVLTWIYALVQMVDMRFYNSRWARRRRAATRIPDNLNAWLFGQMLAWFGIVYYVLTEDVRWFVAGLVILVLSFLVFPVRKLD
jgi:hypothetical protein